jgi:hypothetical protein
MKADDPNSKDTAGTPGEGANPESPQKEEPLFSAAGAAKQKIARGGYWSTICRSRATRQARAPKA